MDASLIQLITDLVMAEVDRSEGALPSSPVKAAPSAEPARGGRRLLLVPAPAPFSSFEPLLASLREVPGVAWTAVRVAGVCEKRVAASLGSVRWIDAPLLWDELIHSMEAVVLPVFRLEILSRVASLLSDVPASAAAVSGIMQGVPVLAGALEVDNLKRSSGRLPGPFLSLFHQHLRTVEGMGIQILENEALVRRLGAKVAAPASAAGKGRDVITVSDLEAAARAGQKTLQVVPGTIVTPLARDMAAQMGIEVIYT
ncbi:MAG: hypothetical protein J0I12_10350 [Candidatus Eremiobacteraeota bacterium]|nr:hypothetical protein [Candidatus Eremiobacteraeota bacterium]